MNLFIIPNTRLGFAGPRSLFRIFILCCLMSIFLHPAICMSRSLPKNDFFIPGVKTFVASYKVLPEGNVYCIKDTDTNLDGTLIHIEPGTSHAQFQINIYINTGYLEFPDGSIGSNPVIEITIEDNVELNQPLKISIPERFDVSSKIKSCFFIKEDRSLSVVLSTPIVSFSDGIRRFSFYTNHSGKYTWLD